jgi:hypothetical protein
MKKWMLIALSCFIVLLAACGNKPSQKEDSHSGSAVKNDIPAEKVGVKAEWKAEDGKDGGKLLLTNSSEKAVGTGVAYKLEKWTDGKWKAVNADQMFTEQMIEVKAGSDYEQPVELKGQDSGTYRVMKTFYENEKKYDVAVVFEKK